MPPFPLRIEVKSARGAYSVYIGSGLLSRASALLQEHGLPLHPLIVTCPPVWRHHGAALRRLTAGRPPVVIADGERAKTLRTVSGIYDAMVERHIDRSGGVVAFGGGVVGDVAGFAAASFLRGIRLVQIPTTLLAQVDSAVGGKTGVNLPSGKNLVGAFHPPALVICDPDVLRTLPRREFRAGLYEVIKYGVIASRAFFDRLSANLPGILAQQSAVLNPVIADCCRTKAAVVGRDERESGPRRILNFGHTVGHALEGITGYRRFRHGEAVAHGMIAAARLSAARGLLSAEDEARIKTLIGRIGPLPRVRDLRISDAMDVLRRDKKVINGRLHFVLASGIGATTIAANVTARELRSAMRSLGMIDA